LHSNQDSYNNSQFTNNHITQNQNQCNCGIFSHQRTNHSDCPLNIRNLRNNTSIDAETNSFIDSLGITNPRFVFSQSDLLLNNEQQTQIIEAENDNFPRKKDHQF
jgi:hypothetical protein